MDKAKEWQEKGIGVAKELTGTRNRVGKGMGVAKEWAGKRNGWGRGKKE
jgi:hypothetical protein